MTIENFIKSFLVKWVDIYNYDRGEYIYNGPSDKLPKEYKKQKVLSFSFSKKKNKNQYILLDRLKKIGGKGNEQSN